MSSSIVLLALFSFFALAVAQITDTTGEFPQEDLSETCQDGASLLDSSEELLEARGDYWSNNGLCFSILENFGGQVQCTQSQDSLKDSCQSLHATSGVEGEELNFCTMTTTGTVNTGNFSFEDGSSNFTFVFSACVPSRCSNQDDIQAYVLSLIIEPLQNGDLEVFFQCDEFFDPVAAIWNEYSLWIIIALVVLVLCCVCGFLCCWWRKRQEGKDKIHDPALLYGPNLAAYGPRNAQPPQDSIAPTEDRYEDEETSSEEEELDEGEELSESDDSETSSYRAPDESQMGMDDHTDYLDDHPAVTVDAAMQQPVAAS